MKPEELVVETIEAVWNAGELDRIAEFYCPDFVAHYPLVGPDWPPGHDGVRGVVSAMRAAFPDYHEQVEDIFASEDRVCVRLKISGTNSGASPFTPNPTGKRVEIGEILICRVTDGKLAEQWGAPAIADLLAQLGVLSSGAQHVT